MQSETRNMATSQTSGKDEPTVWVVMEKRAPETTQLPGNGDAGNGPDMEMVDTTNAVTIVDTLGWSEEMQPGSSDSEDEPPMTEEQKKRMELWFLPICNKCFRDHRGMRILAWATKLHTALLPR